MALRTLFFLNVTYDYALSIKAEHGPILKAIVKEHQITTHPFNPLRRRH